MSKLMILANNPNEVKELWALLEKTDKKNPTKEDRQALFMFLTKYPQLWAYCGDLMEMSAHKLIEATSGAASLAESLTIGLVQMPHELARSTDGPLEKLLIQHIVLCWLRLGYIEYHYTAVTSESNQSMKQIDYWERRLNAAQRRYLRSIETLSRVRRLNVPAIQVNIASQQVNQVNQRG